MTKSDALRRFLLPCFTTTPTTPAPPTHLTNPTKKRLSTSLRDDLDNEPKQEDKKSLEEDDYQDSSNPSTPTLGARPSYNISYSTPRSSKTMVIGTIYGQRPRGNGGGSHVWFSVQHDRTNTKPSLLLELSIPITTLIQEMKSGLVRIALEFKSASGSGQNNPDLTRVPLHLIPMWTLFINGRNVGFAVRRRASRETRVMLKTMQNMTVGAGVIPSGLGSGSGSGDPARVGEEVLYMRANYECIIGGADSESFHLINPDENGPGQEFSIFLLRSK